MGNREIRLFWQTERRRVPRTLLVAAAAIGSLTWLSTCLAAGCEAIAGGEGALLQTVVAVKGPVAVRRPIPVRANSEIIVFARERGVEITLEITDSRNTVLARGDSPTRRTGIQRAQLTPHSGEHYYAIVTKKERASSDGSVELRAIELNTADNSPCLAAQKLLAKADAAYAAGQAIGRAPTNSTGSSPGKSYEQAAAGYREAVEKLRGSGYSPLLGQAQLAEASILNLDLDNQVVEARTWALQAAETFASLGDPYNNARARGLAGAAAADIAVGSGTEVSAKLAEARKQLDQVVAFHAARNDLYDEAWARNYIGLSFYWEGRYGDALGAYKKSLPLYQRLRERTRQAQVLQNIAVVEYDVGRASDALPHLRQALDLTASTGGDPRVLAWILANSAMAHLDSGHEDVGLHELSESLAIARTTGDLGIQSYDLLHIAQIYVKLADQDRALDFYQQALTLFKRLKDVRGETGSMRGMANILRQQGHAAEALQIDREALSLEITPWARSRMNVQIARDLIELGRPAEAANVLEGVLRPGTESNEVIRAQALQERARLRAASNELTAAATDLRTAIATFKTYELTLDEFSSCISLARIMRQLGSATEAFAAVDHALALAEEVRLYSANPELRSTLLQPLRPAFDLKVSMLSERYAAAKGNANEQETLAVRALETAEQARARALADYQAIDLTAAGLDPTLLKRRETLYRNLAERRVRLADTLDTAGVVNSQVQAIRSEIATVRQELDQIDAKIGALSASNAARRAATKSTSIQLANVPPGIAIVEYWLGSKDAYAWVITRDGVHMAPIGTSSAINSQAVALHTALRSFGSVPKADRLAAGERLYALVLGPIANRVAGYRTLIFAPDGALHYVPFATLRYSEAGRGVFLVQNHDIAVTPSVQMFLQPGSVRPEPAPPRRMLLVDDPVYDPGDPRVTRDGPAIDSPKPRINEASLSLVRGATPVQGSSLARLPGAAREAAAIAGLMPAGTVDRLEGFAANRDRFLASALGQYQLIHVASHATMDSEIPQASALILSTVDSSGKKIDGRVLGADFLGVRLHADTVVLSACDTALGKDVAGEGLIGLQYAVLARGARSVVSSLWPAIDPVTAPLMVEFYSALLHQHSSVISAWSAASRAALAGAYGDPGTWGAFMLTLSHVEDLNTR